MIDNRKLSERLNMRVIGGYVAEFLALERDALAYRKEKHLDQNGNAIIEEKPVLHTHPLGFKPAVNVVEGPKHV